MMKLIFLACILVLAADYASAQATTARTTKKWAIQPHEAKYKKGEVDAKTNKDQDAVMTVDKAKIGANANVEGRGDFNANRDPSAKEKAVVKNPKGNSATGDQSQKGAGTRTGDAGKYHGEMKQTKVSSDTNVNLALNTGQKMDTNMRGDKKSFDATGSKGNKETLTPQSQSKTGGKGTITRNNNEKYDYQENKAANGDTNAQLSNVGKQKKTYTCQGQKQGVSNCVDQNGMKVGEVVSQPDGTVIVKKTVNKGVDVPIAKSKVTKDSSGRAVASVNDGLFQGQAGNYRERDCMSDYGKKSSKLKIEKPFTFKYNSQKTSDGKTEYIWPDCVTLGGKITLPPGMDVSRLAAQFDVSILPAGKMKCVDAAACNKDCYYCNLCNNTKKADMLSNSDSQNTCQAKGGQTYQLQFTACPPPEAFNKALCSGFTKSDPTYFKKKGDIQTRLVFWERPINEAKLKSEFNYKLKTDSTGLVKKTWVLQYSVDNKNLINAKNPTDFDLEEWYIHKFGANDEVVGCIEGTTNYTLTGKTVRTDFLLEAGSIATAPKSLFDTKSCPEVDKVNQAQAQQDMADAAKTFTTKAGFFGGNFFGGGKKR